MSISSTSEPPYNGFYDQQSFSTRELQTVAAATDQISAGHYSQRSDGLLYGLLAPFKGCCFSKPKPTVSHDRTGNTSALSYLVSVDALSDTGSSETSQDGKASREKWLPKSTKKLLGRETQSVARLRAQLEHHGIQWVDVTSTHTIDAAAHWIITCSLPELMESSWLQLTQADCEIMALDWCRRLELSQKMTAKAFLEMVNSAGNIVQSVTLQRASLGRLLEHADEYSILELVRLVEARMVQEVMGEFQSATEVLSSSDTCVYLIIAHVRTVAVCCRDQGDIRSLLVFDTGISRTRGPAFLGFLTYVSSDDISTDVAFCSVEEVEAFLFNLYSADHNVTRSTEKFAAWTLRSKQEGRKKLVEVEQTALQPSYLSTSVYQNDRSHDDGLGPDGSVSDATADITAACQALYDATEQTGAKEHVFSATAAGGISVTSNASERK